jgi:hypothetical protein
MIFSAISSLTVGDLEAVHSTNYIQARNIMSLAASFSMEML